jgi:hypothetical protein
MILINFEKVLVLEEFFCLVNQYLGTHWNKFEAFGADGKRTPKLRLLIGQEDDRGEPALPSFAKAGWRAFLSWRSSSEVCKTLLIWGSSH